MYSSQQITEWFLAHEPMPPKKLQELVYYTQGWSNALLKPPLLTLIFRLGFMGLYLMSYGKILSFHNDINVKIAFYLINIEVFTI